MKLKIDINTFEILEVDDFQQIPEIKTNSQHVQLPGFILAQITMNPGQTGINLFHPETSAMTGHVDVGVRYLPNSIPRFYQYSQSQEFVPIDADPVTYVWPTGAWSLVQTVLAIETFLERRVGFLPVLRDSFLQSLSRARQERNAVPA